MIPSLSSTPVIPVTPPSGVPAGAAASRREEPGPADTGTESVSGSAASDTGAGRSGSSANPSGLDDQQLQELQQLKARDREVRAHEAAHQTVGGRYAGAVSYTFQRGPDGNQYAIGGEVSIDISPVQGDPQATIEKMRIVKAAAMAPSQPSAQDRAVAAQATQLMLQAQAELAAQPRDSDNPADSAEAADQPSADSSFAIDTYRSLSGEADTGRSVFQAIA